MADDHRHDALGCAGHPYVRTPALDRVAAGGVRFTIRLSRNMSEV
jgi:choline-sulfatase